MPYLKTARSYLEKKHTENLVLIAKLRESSFYEKIKIDRDKKFAHTDLNSNPLSIDSYNENEIETGFQHLNLMKKIMDNCTGFYDYSFAFQHADTRTDNFIKFQTNYKEYYFKNYFKAKSEGF